MYFKFTNNKSAYLLTLVCDEVMAKCPECGKPLVKRTRKGKYNCENEQCSVIYVRYPNVPALRAVVYEASRKSCARVQ